MRYIAARYSEMNYRGYFKISEESDLAKGRHCLVRSPRGIELGKILCNPVEYDGEIIWLKNHRTGGQDTKPGGGVVLMLSGEVVRPASPEDMEKISKQHSRGTAEEIEFCNSQIKARSLKMKLAGVEYLFNGEKIIFYFLADGRVDFRALVRDLAKKYRTRIEMKQIGVRDEARLLAEYEHCGRRLCCKGFLNTLEPVTMKMAKVQKTTLDPSKISGRCGRLMCCLRYEDNVYQELKTKLPRKGSFVTVNSERGKVLSQDILLQKVVVQLESGEFQLIHINDIESVHSNAPIRQSPRKSRPQRKQRRGKDNPKSNR